MGNVFPMPIVAQVWPAKLVPVSRPRLEVHLVKVAMIVEKTNAAMLRQRPAERDDNVPELLVSQTVIVTLTKHVMPQKMSANA
tara:strand:+ start:6754 stop:7002 length:249 start_codon:yes stop_codon:yes gene_type:complete